MENYFDHALVDDKCPTYNNETHEKGGTKMLSKICDFYEVYSQEDSTIDIFLFQHDFRDIKKYLNFHPKLYPKYGLIYNYPVSSCNLLN